MAGAKVGFTPKQSCCQCCSAGHKQAVQAKGNRYKMYANRIQIF